MKRIAAVTLVLSLTCCRLFAQSSPWVSAYYAGWMQSYLPPSAIDYGAVTHIIHFSISPTSGGNISGTGNGITPSSSAAIVQAAHAAGKKVLITCGGWGDDQGFVTNTNASNRTTFVKNLVGFVIAHGYDGLDIDWEPITSASQFKLFIPELRAALDAARPGLLLTIALMGGDPSAVVPVSSAFDQINIMTYDMSGAWQGWVVWHNAPVYNGGRIFPGTNSFVPSANADVDQFVAAGIPKGKLGIGADYYGYVWSGVTQPGQTWSSTPDVTANVPYYELMNTYGANPVQWDSSAQAAYISVTSGSGKFISLDNERTMFAKAEYVRTKGIGGIIIWELGGGYRATAPAGQRDRLLQAVKQAFFGSGPPPSADSVAPVVAFSAPPGGAVLAGMVSVTATAVDNGGVAGVQFRIDGANLGNEIGAAPYAVTLNTWQLANGQHTLSATARDYAGNSATASLTVTIQNDGPPPVSPDLVVYDDALRSPFRDASWSATPNYQNTDPVLLGSNSVKVVFSAWGGFDILSGRWNAEVPIDITAYDSLRFGVYPTTSLTLTIGFYVGETTTITIPAARWSTYALPLPREPFSRFYFTSEASGSRTAYFDMIRFTGGAGAVSGIAEDQSELPEAFALEQNYPNPFNPSTRIRYRIGETNRSLEGSGTNGGRVHALSGLVRLAVCDVLGREVAVLVEEQQQPGVYEVTFDASGLASGVYLYRLEAAGQTFAQRMVLMR